MTRPRTVVAIVAAQSERRRLVRLARLLQFNLRCFTAARDAGPFIAAHPVFALIVSPLDAAGCPVGPMLAGIRHEAPAVGVVIVVERDPSAPAVLAALRHADRVVFGDDLRATTLWPAVYAARAARRPAARDSYTSAPTNRVGTHGPGALRLR